MLARSNSDQSPLYDVRNHADPALIQELDCETVASRTVRMAFDALHRRLIGKPSGGARRDRTDDLMLAKHALSQLSYGPVPEDERHLLMSRALLDRVVGLGRLELPTSRLSSARSNQLSYKPQRRGTGRHAPARKPMRCASAAPGACSSAKKEKRRRRCPANAAQRSGDLLAADVSKTNR